MVSGSDGAQLWAVLHVHTLKTWRRSSQIALRVREFGHQWACCVGNVGTSG